jgi:hypothetical protein
MSSMPKTVPKEHVHFGVVMPPQVAKTLDEMRGPIPPRGFAEYVAANLSPGSYAFYSSNSTSTKGVLTIEPSS